MRRLLSSLVPVLLLTLSACAPDDEAEPPPSPQTDGACADEPACEPDADAASQDPDADPPPAGACASDDDCGRDERCIRHDLLGPAGDRFCKDDLCTEGRPAAECASVAFEGTCEPAETLDRGCTLPDVPRSEAEACTGDTACLNHRCAKTTCPGVRWVDDEDGAAAVREILLAGEPRTGVDFFFFGYGDGDASWKIMFVEPGLAMVTRWAYQVPATNGFPSLSWQWGPVQVDADALRDCLPPELDAQHSAEASSPEDSNLPRRCVMAAVRLAE